MISPPFHNIKGGTLRAFRGIWIAFMVAVTSFPYLSNFLNAPAGYHYTWILPPYPEDSLAYQVWAEQAANGKLLFQIKYTALPHAAFLFHPFFLVAGWISALFGCDVGIVLWVLKAVGVALFFITFFKYADYLGLSAFQSIVASILAGISSGLGGLFAFLNLGGRLPAFLLPADLWVVDVNTFYSLLWNPLFPYSLTLILLSIYWLDRGTREARKSDLWGSGLTTGILALIHPYSQPLLIAFAVIMAVVRRKREAPAYLWRYFLALLPFLLYLVWVAAWHPLVSRHNITGVMQSPDLAAYLAGFGIPLLMAVIGVIMGRRRLLKQYWPVVLWFLLSLAFAYLPVWFQRKLIFGAHVPLCLVAGMGFDLFLARFPMRARKGALIVIVLVLLPLLASTPIYLLAVQRAQVRKNADGAYFVSRDVMAGLKFLKANSKPDEVVFATPETSSLIPAFAGNTVVWGHWAMSVDAKEREEWMADLFNEHANWNDSGRARAFWGTDIQYIFADDGLKQALEQSPEEWRAILGEADKVFENGSVVIYRHRNK